MLSLRHFEDSDFDTIFEFQSDEVSSQMATVAPKSRDAYLAHIAKIQGNPDCIIRIIEDDGTIVGFAVSWLGEDGRNVGYWIGRQFWGKGYASKGLSLLVNELNGRPLVAHVASTNLGSQKVLEKNGFTRAASIVVDDPTFGSIELLTYQI